MSQQTEGHFFGTLLGVCFFIEVQNAKENNFKVEKHPADWKRYGRSTGPKRNRDMAEICDYVICFWDLKSKGTRSMIDYAKKLDKPIKIKKIYKGYISFENVAFILFCL